jgi:hypothetical protein
LRGGGFLDDFLPCFSKECSERKKMKKEAEEEKKRKQAECKATYDKCMQSLEGNTAPVSSTALAPVVSQQPRPQESMPRPQESMPRPPGMPQQTQGMPQQTQGMPQPGMPGRTISLDTTSSDEEESGM